MSAGRGARGGACGEARAGLRGWTPGGLEAEVQGPQRWVSTPGRGVCLFALLSPPAGSFVFCRPVQCFSPLGGSTAEGGKGVKAKRRVGCRGEQAGI